MPKRTGFRKRSYQQSQEIAKRILKYFLLVAGLLILTNFIKFAVISSYAISGDGMEPTYNRNNLVLASTFGLSDFYDKLPMKRQIKRGDVVLMRVAGEDQRSFVAKSINPTLRFISGNFLWIPSKKEKMGLPELVVKRVVAVPGDTIRMQGNEAFIKRADGDFFVSEFEASHAVYEIIVPMRHEDWQAFSPFSGDVNAYTLQEDEYFVLGDNRKLMNDSRTFGVISRYDMHAVVLFKYFGH